MSEAPKLNRIVRMDSIKPDTTYFTEEGYLRDCPVVTTCGIFEYKNPDGSTRRELRLPENVFAEESLASYKGKPIIITHAAGEVDKDNVNREQIGTILSQGMRDGNNVRAEIVINDTNAMRRSGLKELSLGYDLELDETPGVFEGQPYDAIQKDIRVNHLALVMNARAGGKARLNIDGRDKLEGGKIMSKRKDGETLTPENFAAAIEKFKARQAARGAGAEAHDGIADPPAPHAEPDGDEGLNHAASPDGDGDETAKIVQGVKDRRDRRDAAGDPADTNAAMGVIAQQDEDLDMLLNLIEQLCAKQDFDSAEGEPANGSAPAPEDPAKKDGDDSKSGAMNADSIDEVVKTRLALGRLGDKLNLDSLENLSIPAAKMAVIKKVKPNMRLDGKSEAYVNAAFDLSVAEVNAPRGTNYQRQQMLRKEGTRADGADDTEGTDSAASSRQKMIERRNGGNK